jgi:hypothetical protein
LPISPLAETEGNGYDSGAPTTSTKGIAMEQENEGSAQTTERHLPSRQVAAACGCHPKTLGLWRRIPGRGPEPFVMVSIRRYVYPESAVLRWLAARQGQLAPPAFPQADDDADFGVAPLPGDDVAP